MVHIQKLSWGLVGAALLVTVVAPGARAAAPGQGLMCPARRVASAYIYTDAMTGAGQSFFYWRAYRLALIDALQAAANVDHVVAKANRQLTCPAGCEKQGAPACKRMGYNPSDPAYPGKFGRNLARHTCQQVRALRDRATRIWLVKVSCRVLFSCQAMCQKIQVPVVPPNPKPKKPPVGQQPPNEPDVPPKEDPRVDEDAPEEDPTQAEQPEAPAQDPVVISEPSVQSAADTI